MVEVSLLSFKSVRLLRGGLREVRYIEDLIYPAGGYFERVVAAFCRGGFGAAVLDFHGQGLRRPPTVAVEAASDRDAL